MPRARAAVPGRHGAGPGSPPAGARELGPGPGRAEQGSGVPSAQLSAHRAEQRSQQQRDRTRAAWGPQ